MLVPDHICPKAQRRDIFVTGRDQAAVVSSGTLSDSAQHVKKVPVSAGFRMMALVLALSTGGCAANVIENGPAREKMLRANALSTGDPYEASNRETLLRNKVINDVAISPAAHAYRGIVPAIIRDRVSSGISNLQEPRIFVNDVLQLRLDAAAKTFGRFLVNSTFGIGGLFDLAAQSGLPQQTGDFGQTLYTFGVPSGPFLIAPVFGPTTIRDGFGQIVDMIADPSGYAIQRGFGLYPVLGIGVVNGLDKAELLDDLEAGSLDYYARLRSIYLQKRAAELGDAVGIQITPDNALMPNASAAAATTQVKKVVQRKKIGRGGRSRRH